MAELTSFMHCFLDFIFFGGKVTYTPPKSDGIDTKKWWALEKVSKRLQIWPSFWVFARRNARSRKLRAERWMRIDGTGGDADDSMTWRVEKNLIRASLELSKVGQKSLIFVVSFSLEQDSWWRFVRDGKLGSLDFFIGWEEFFFWRFPSWISWFLVLHEKFEAGGDDSTWCFGPGDVVMLSRWWSGGMATVMVPRRTGRMSKGGSDSGVWDWSTS